MAYQLNLPDIGEGLTQDQRLEADDHEHDRQQVSHRLPEPACQRPHVRRRDFQPSLHGFRPLPSVGIRAGNPHSGPARLSYSDRSRVNDTSPEVGESLVIMANGTCEGLAQQILQGR